jgi:hypothetical protein
LPHVKLHAGAAMLTLASRAPRYARSYHKHLRPSRSGPAHLFHHWPRCLCAAAARARRSNAAVDAGDGAGSDGHRGRAGGGVAVQGRGAAAERAVGRADLWEARARLARHISRRGHGGVRFTMFLY